MKTKYYINGGRNNVSYFITESDIETGGFVDFVDEDFAIETKEEAEKILSKLNAYEEEIGVDYNLHIQKVYEQ